MQDFETATNLLKSPDLTLRERNIITASLDYENLKEHTTEWLDWLESNEENEELQTYVTKEIVEQWTRDDFAAAGEWVQNQEAGPAKNNAIQTYAETLAPHEPAAAADWATTLPAGEERTQLLQTIHTSLQKKDPAAAAALAEKQGLPSEN